MIEIWYRERGNRPAQTQIIRDDADKADVLPSSFEMQGAIYGRRTGEDTVDSSQFALVVDPPSDNISQDAVDSIATAFEDNWGGTIEHVETIVQS